MFEFITPLVEPTLTGLTGGEGKTKNPDEKYALSTLSDRTAINIAPVGVNFGDLLREMNVGSEANGGQGVHVRSRYLGTGASLPTMPDKVSINKLNLIAYPAIALALAAGVYFIFIR
jgi:hypothetical protein